MKNMSKLIVGSMFALCVSIGAYIVCAEPTTNKTYNVDTVAALKDTSVVQDQNVYATSTDRRGLIVAHYDFAQKGGAVSAIKIGYPVPKGAILLDDAVIEVQTPINPAGSTNSITLGGVTVLAAGTTLNSTGIKDTSITPGITTSSNAYVTVNVIGNAATAGVFTVYIPYVLGNAE